MGRNVLAAHVFSVACALTLASLVCGAAGNHQATHFASEDRGSLTVFSSGGLQSSKSLARGPIMRAEEQELIAAASRAPSPSLQPHTTSVLTSSGNRAARAKGRAFTIEADAAELEERTPSPSPGVTYSNDNGNAEGPRNDAGKQADGVKALPSDPDGNSADSVSTDQDLNDDIDIPSQWTWDKCVLAILLGTGITSAITLMVAIVGIAVTMAMKQPARPADPTPTAALIENVQPTPEVVEEVVEEPVEEPEEEEPQGPGFRQTRGSVPTAAF